MIDPNPTVVCDHCRLPVPKGLLDPESDRQFCCNGCRTVFAILRQHGLEEYYDVRRRLGADAEAAQTTDKSYEEYDHDAFRELYVRSGPDGSESMEFYLEGVHCAACVWLVEKLPRLDPGVIEARLDLSRSSARIRWSPEKTELSNIARRLDALGYAPHPYRGIELRRARKIEDRRMLIRIAVAAACMANVMMIAFALYGGYFDGMEPALQRFFRWMTLLIALPSIFYAGAPFFRGAWSSLRLGALHMDLPIALGIGAGAIWGTRNILVESGEIYFDSVTMLIFLLLVGRYLQQRGQRASADASEWTHAYTPTTVRRVADAGVEVAPIEAVNEGDVLEIPPGETIPVDGVLVEGATEINAALLTGESQPAVAREGDNLFAGTINLSSPIRIRAVSSGEATRLGRLMSRVEEAASRKAPIATLADRISGFFVAAVLACAAITWLLWRTSDPTGALDHAIALLIVTCPCALGLATPLAVSAAIGRAARTGILILGGDALEAMSRPGVLFLDKTGTLTEGRGDLIAWNGPQSLLPDAAALERNVVHPIAQALARAAGQPEAPPRVEEVAQHQGGGIEGRVNGRRIAIGSPQWIAQRVTQRAPEFEAATFEAASNGHTPLLIAEEGRVVASAAIGERLRADSRSAIEAFRKRGWEVRLLSGDHPESVRRVAQQLGLGPEACLGGVSPEEKLRIIEESATKGLTVMVGDGVNDAAAIARATVGIGMHGGAEASLASADIHLAQSGLDSLIRLVEGAHRTMRIIRRNFVFSLGYNLIGASLAMAGAINPIAAAILMPASSLTVVIASYRSKSFEESPT